MTPNHNSLDQPHLAFDGRTTKEEAVARFIERYRTQPENVIYCNGLLWVGPVPEEAARP